MTHTKHTPGPWKIIPIEDAARKVWDCVYYEDGNVDHHLACVEGKANARLIAAAPELLEAAKAVAKWLGRDINDWDSLRAAIAKAEGTNG